MRILTSDFDYHLPPELIAQTPLKTRDDSRLLVLHRATGLTEHRSFRDILEYVRAGDVMVFNQSRVIPARLRGRRASTGGKVELLLLRRESPGVWLALGQPGRRLRPGERIIIEPGGNEPPNLPPSQGGVTGAYQPQLPGSPTDEKVLEAEVLASHPDGIKTVRLESEADILLMGETPLPPYIHQRLEDPERYQTIYASESGSAAAPTAGLHFTETLMGQLKEAGVELAFVTLHVGLDTFRPIQGEDPSKHKIHTEYFHLDAQAANCVNQARAEGRRVIAVGTTTVRVLEQAARLMLGQDNSQIGPISGQADLFILPGYRFQVVDALITNFHLPKSTLLMLVSAFAGREHVLAAYAEAIEHKYRFYSFGDAMVIL